MPTFSQHQNKENSCLQTLLAYWPRQCWHRPWTIILKFQISVGRLIGPTSLLPTPTNLQRWGIREGAHYACCVQGEARWRTHWWGARLGRYRWRHDKVLRAPADILEQERLKKSQSHLRTALFIQFIREWEKPLFSNTTKKSLLQTAQWWKMTKLPPGCHHDA